MFPLSFVLLTVGQIPLQRRDADRIFLSYGARQRVYRVFHQLTNLVWVN